MIENLLLQFHKFPFAESIHSLQGIVIGILIARGYLADSLVRVMIALVLMSGFIAYETLEQYRIGDMGDLDVSAMLIAAWLSAMVTLVVHLLWTRKKS